ncbi:hypothetical protein [Amycolatopsis japonica]
MSTQGNPKLTIRMDPAKRQDFIARAEQVGTTGSRLVGDFIDWWMGEPDARLPEPFRPGKEE